MSLNAKIQKAGDCGKIFPEIIGNKNRQIAELFSDQLNPQKLNRNMGTGFRVGQGMVVGGQVIAAGGRHGLQLVVRQSASVMLTGSC